MLAVAAVIMCVAPAFAETAQNTNMQRPGSQGVLATL
jgi:hypothetical protein